MQTAALTEPEFPIFPSKSVLVVVPAAVEILAAVLASLNHLKCYNTR